MGDVLFTFDVEAGPDAVRRALTTTEGITSFWTDKAEVPAEVGGTMTVGFPDAPAPFDLVVDQSDQDTVAWRTASFPPQWVGTDIRWNISGGEQGSTVAFRHGSFADDNEEARVAFVWGQVMTQLKRYVETGIPAPVFVHP
jgi:hypothetical protein